MMDLSDRHCRYFWRLFSKHALLYTEMVTCGALIHGDVARFLRFDHAEHPLALQVGGSDPKQLASCARLAQQWGYDEINLNVGCPSNRVQAGRFGACLMAEPELVRDCLAAMLDASDIPVTVKHRIGIDELDSDHHLHHFVKTVAESGCNTFIVHARKAWLNGLSPKQNREVPSLQYDRVFHLKQAFPALEFVINGGIDSVQQSRKLLQQVDGVMLGRAAYQNPACLEQVDTLLFDSEEPSSSQREVVEKMLPYIENELGTGCRLNHITRHMTGLFQGTPGARRYRRYLSEHATLPGAGPEVLLAAVAELQGPPSPLAAAACS